MTTPYRFGYRDNDANLKRIARRRRLVAIVVVVLVVIGTLLWWKFAPAYVYASTGALPAPTALLGEPPVTMEMGEKLLVPEVMQ